MRKLVLLGALVSALLGLAAGPAAAAPTARVALDVSENFEAGGETFLADGGVVCRSGTTSSETVIKERGPLVTFDNHKTVICDVGSGTFRLRIFAWVRPCATFDRVVWRVEVARRLRTPIRPWHVGRVLPARQRVYCHWLQDHLTGRMSLGR